MGESWFAKILKFYLAERVNAIEISAHKASELPEPVRRATIHYPRYID